MELTVNEVLILLGQHQIEIAKRDKMIAALQARIKELEAKPTPAAE